MEIDKIPNCKNFQNHKMCGQWNSELEGEEGRSFKKKLNYLILMPFSQIFLSVTTPVSLMKVSSPCS